jgi:hypothetical protein
MIMCQQPNPMQQVVSSSSNNASSGTVLPLFQTTASADDFVNMDFRMENFFNDELGTTSSVVAMTASATVAPTPTPLPTTSSSSSNIMMIPTMSATSTTPSMFVAPLPTTDESFVNVYMYYCPLQQAVVCPRQTITFQTGQVVSTAVVGPTIIQQAQFESFFLNNNTNTTSTTVTPVYTTSSLSCISSLVAAATTTTSSQQQQPHMPLIPSSSVSSSSSSSSSSVSSSSSSSSCSYSNKKTTIKKSRTVSSVSLLNNNNSGIPLPLHALSAYNFFFRDERNRILENLQHDHHHCETEMYMIEMSVEKQQQLLQDHWNRDRTTRRRHRKTHGKIDFKTLSRQIVTSWKRLPQEHKDFYKQVAIIDLQRYKRDKQAYEAAVAAAAVATMTAPTTTTTAPTLSATITATSP